MDTVTAGIIQESKKRQTAATIHKYATAHAATAALLAQTEIGDELCLTILTTAMMFTIVAINGGKWTAKFAAAVLGIAGGTVIGIKAAMLLVKWIPLVGNAVNATASLFTTELLGWTAYALLSSGRDPENLTEAQKAEIKQMAENLKNKENTSKSGRELYKKMSRSDKRAIDDLLKTMRKSKSEEVASELALKMAKIIERYT
jgi:uncharacterized protein (DUF697 family)